MATNKFEAKNKKVSESKIENFINTKKEAFNVGRKPKDTEKKKTKSVTLYLSESDYEIIKERADKKRLSVSQYIISSLFEWLEIELQG